VPQLVGRAPIVGGILAGDTEVVEIGGNLAVERARAVDSPKRCLVIGRVVKESEVVEIRTNSPGVNVPRSDLAQNLESVKALPDVWPVPGESSSTVAGFLTLVNFPAWAMSWA